MFEYKEGLQLEQRCRLFEKNASKNIEGITANPKEASREETNLKLMQRVKIQQVEDQGKSSRSKTTQELTCYRCKKQGHVAKFCPTRKTTTKTELIQQILGCDPQVNVKPQTDPLNGKIILDETQPQGELAPTIITLASQGGWWDCDMEGVDSEEVGHSEVWEGVGSITYRKDQFSINYIFLY
ncbi:unnamed protein product [Arabis nemorensis]|uniref:CCHC-type domain-containing protein n=1 Tax=Arabis nemorensis TaxID=586526 RepID=A0A565CK87_9BRAS|nr:unnamed protein product [Arabis nemorensis]